jgi:hemolysin III
MPDILEPAPRAMPHPPLLRGWLHLICFFISVPAGVILLTGATTTRGRVGVLAYAIGLVALFGVSGTYHRGRWSPAGRAKMKRLDHATIFVMIAGSYTPLCLLALGGAAGTWMLVAVWAGAGTGLILTATRVSERRGVALASYFALGWVAAIAMPELARRLTTAEFILLIVGGLVYTLGGVVLASHWPDPIPRIFGYHEVWHLMVVGAAICHFVVITDVVRASG